MVIIWLFLSLFLLFLLSSDLLVLCTYLWFFYGKLSFFFGSFSFSFFFNFFSVGFFVLFFIISLCVFSYKCFYMGGESRYFVFGVFFIVFLFSISFLIFSCSFWTLVFFWDLLGVSSFVLILYYISQSSVLGGLSTSIVGRLGDFFLLFSLLPLFFLDFIYGGWFGVLGFFFIISSFAKSAQWPFISWLPRAISAPTPVSSLVHSSTLVVAGLLLFWFFSWVLSDTRVSIVLVSFSIFTLFFSGVLALVEKDIKKLVALSTMSQISLCILSLGFFIVSSSYWHSLSHAFFKSGLFLVLGFLIYSSFGQQDLRKLSGSSFSFVYSFFLICSSGLCGVLFTSGSVTKEALVSLIFSFTCSSFWLFLFFLSIFLTFSYSFLIWRSFSSIGGAGQVLTSLSRVYLFSIFPLIFFGLFCMNFISCNFFVFPVFFIAGDLISALFFMSVLLTFRPLCGALYYFSSLFLTGYFLYFASNILFRAFFFEALLGKVFLDFFLVLGFFRSFLLSMVFSHHSLFFVGALVSLYLIL